VRGTWEQDFSSGLSDCFLQFFILKMRKVVPTLIVGRSLQRTREKRYKVLFSVYTSKLYFQMCVWGRGEWHNTRGKRESQYTQPSDSPVLLEDQRCPGRLLDCSFWHGACKDCPANIYAGKPWVEMDMLSPLL